MTTTDSADIAEPRLIEDARRELRAIAAEIAELGRRDLEPAEFWRAFLPRVVTALAAPGGVVWIQDETLGWRHECDTGLGPADRARRGLQRAGSTASAAHAALLDDAAQRAAPLAVSRQEAGDDHGASFDAGPLLLLCPVRLAGETAAVVEVLQRAEGGAAAQRGFRQFLAQSCEVAEGYLLGRQVRLLTAQRELWEQWDNFCQAAHRGLDARRTAYAIANEGRRLIGCDRLSVLLIRGRRPRLEAVSGQDGFDARAASVVAAEHLAQRVAATSEPMWHASAESSGNCDDPEDAVELPPQIAAALQCYLDTTHVRHVSVLPLRPPAAAPLDGDSNSSTGSIAPIDSEPCAVLLVDHFSRMLPLGQRERMEAVARQAALALANAQELQQVLLLPVWRAVARVRRTLLGPAWPRTATVALVVLSLVAALALIPADFELEGRGTLVPVVDHQLFAPADGQIAAIHVEHGQLVAGGDVLLEMRSTELDLAVTDFSGQLSAAEERLRSIESTLLDGGARFTAVERERLHGEKGQLEATIAGLRGQLELAREQRRELAVRSPIAGQVVTWDALDRLRRRPVSRGEALLQVVDPAGEWELEVLLPEDRLGHVHRAERAAAERGEAPQVEYILATDPARTLRGTVRQIARIAEMRGEAGNVVPVRVAIDRREIADPRHGAAVVARIHCGRRSIGYVWLHDAWAVIQSKLLFRW